MIFRYLMPAVLINQRMCDEGTKSDRLKVRILKNPWRRDDERGKSPFCFYRKLVSPMDRICGQIYYCKLPMRLKRIPHFGPGTILHPTNNHFMRYRSSFQLRHIYDTRFWRRKTKEKDV